LWRGTFIGDGFSRLPVSAALWGVVPILIAFCIFVAVERQDWILNNAVGSAVGALSYSLYLWQQPFTVVHTVPAALSLAMVAFFAFLSYALVKKPVRDFGRCLGQGRSVIAIAGVVAE
jgi:peptidoglycan/LPS O-acetylase OafA/YrhL